MSTIIEEFIELAPIVSPYMEDDVCTECGGHMDYMEYAELEEVPAPGTSPEAPGGQWSTTGTDDDDEETDAELPTDDTGFGGDDWKDDKDNDEKWTDSEGNPPAFTFPKKEDPMM